MKTVYIIILIISSLILNISCDNSLGLDNNVQKNPKGEVSDWDKYIGFEIGNYWVYDEYLLEEKGESLFRESRRFMTIGEKEYAGKKCVVFGIFSSTILQDSQFYMYFYENKVFISTIFFNFNDLFPEISISRQPHLSDGWVLISDFEDDDGWNGFEQKFENEFIGNYKEQKVYFSGSISIRGNLAGYTSINIKGFDVKSIIVNVFYDFQGKVTVGNKDTDIGIYTGKMTWLWGKNVGWLGMKIENPEHDWGFGIIPYFGIKYNVKDYYVKW